MSCLLIVAGLLASGMDSPARAQVTVIDIYDGSYFSSPASSYPGHFRSAGGTVFFEVDDRFGGGDTYGEMLWTTDGTEAGTEMLKDTKSGGDDGGFILGDWASRNGTLYFASEDGSNGRELWKSDGTTSGTQMVKDINPSGDGVSSEEFVVYKNEVYFEASDGSGYELWKTDGSASGTVLVKDLDADVGARPSSFTLFNDQLFFVTASDRFLWKTDGTESGTVSVVRRDGVIGPDQLTAAGSTLFFTGWYSGSGQDRALWSYTGSAQIVKNIGYLEDFRHLTAFNGNLYFTVETSDHGRELWTSDGTDAGTQLIKDINPGTESGIGSDPDFTSVGDQLFFVANDGTTGDELWVTDGTSSGTHLVKDLTSSPAGVGLEPPYDLTAMDNRVYFGVSTTTYGEEVWSSDGTAANTVRLTNFKSGDRAANPNGLYAHEGTLYFEAQDTTHGHELWVSNGVPSATRTVKSDATFDFGETGADLIFSGVGTTGSVTIEKLETAPSDTSGIPSGRKVSTYRFVIDAEDALSFTSADLRLDVSTLSGISNASNVELYKRPTSGDGSFTELTTNYESDPNELVATVNSFSEFVLVSDSEPLPVALARFEGTNTEDGVQLAWQTASETKNAGFRVQRRVSDEEAEWTQVGRVAGSGTATEAQSYRFTDADLPYDADRLTYRLKQIDTDGTTSFSDEVTVERGAVEALRLLGTYPNPVRTTATVRYAVPERNEGPVRLRLYDVLGRQVHAVTTDATAGRHERQLKTASLSSGVYFLRLQAGGAVKTQRLTVVR